MNNAQMMGYFAGYDTKRAPGIAKEAGILGAVAKGGKAVLGGLKSAGGKALEVGKAAALPAAAGVTGTAVGGVVGSEAQKALQASKSPVEDVKAAAGKVGELAAKNPGTTAAIAGSGAIATVLAAMLAGKLAARSAAPVEK